MSAITQATPAGNTSRHGFLLGVMVMLFAGLLGRAAYVQLISTDYLQAQGDSRYLRSVTVAPIRGRILDRDGQPIAISTPVDSVWAHPQTLADHADRWPELTDRLGLKRREMAEILARHDGREFAYLKRALPPADAQAVLALGVPGVFLQREYRRYYPTGPVFGHVLGFTNIDDRGQEGLELAFDQRLAGAAGRKRVMRDRLGHIVEDVENIRAVEDGRDLRTSLDPRIQYLSFRALQNAVARHGAQGGTAVVLDVASGEILAMVNEPAFNPNNRADITGGRFRNRAVTDLVEPGSTVKPFTAAMALASGRMRPDTVIDTTPGWWVVGGRTVRDVHNYGELDLNRVIVKSSNIGVAKIAMQFPVKKLLGIYRDIGFGAVSGVSLPGESPGVLPARNRWREIEHATLAFGYGLAVTPLQLARAYSVFATDGRLLPTTILQRPGPVRSEQVVSPAVAAAIRDMLEQVTGRDGTAQRARVPQYRVAGKTGTVRKLGPDGRYTADQYQALFVGFAPVSNPAFIMAVVIDEPSGKQYYGGQVAAPVFAEVMQGTLRLRNVPPDDLGGPRPDLERT